MNYQSLYTNIQDYLARDDISYSLFDLWLRIVEKKLNSRLTTVADYSFYTAELEDDSLELPSDFRQGMVTKIGGKSIVLQYKGVQQYEETKDVFGYFTIKNNRLYLSGNIGNIEVTLEYNRTITPLSSTNTENEIIINYPDLYLSGVLKEAAIWSKDSTLNQLHKANFEEALTEANWDSVSKAMSGSQLVMRSDLNCMGGQ